MKYLWTVGAVGAIALLVLCFWDQIAERLVPNTPSQSNGWARNNCSHWEGDYDLLNQQQELPFNLRITWDDGAKLRITNGRLTIDLSAAFLLDELHIMGTDGIWSKFKLLPRRSKQSEVLGFGIEGTSLYARRTKFARQQPPSWLNDNR